MKKPIIVISTDWHLKESNIERLVDLVKQKCELAISLDVKEMAVAGDIFDSRKAQTQDNLTALGRIFDIISSYGLTAWIIPGNHDKTYYGSSQSFLDTYKHHPNIKLISLTGGIPFKGGMIRLLPFYQDEVWIEEFNKLLSYMEPISGKNILISHQAFTGSTNNDGTKVLSKISTTMFTKFDLVLFGHYHNQQQVAQNCFHMPSIQQNDFGENDQKGFTVLYDDCSFELVLSKFKGYKKVVIDLDTVSNKELDVLTADNADSDTNVRFEFIGQESKVKSINKELFKSVGIDVKTKVKEIEDNIQFAEAEIQEYTAESIVDEFKEFCDEKDKNYEEGIIYLNEKVKNHE